MPTMALPESVRDVGPYWEPNLELIQQLQPQLILSDPMTPTLQRRLNGIAPTERSLSTRLPRAPGKQLPTS